MMMLATAVLSAAMHLSWGGAERTYHVYRAPSVAAGSRPPLVVVLHGGFGSGTQAEKAYGWDAQADTGRFVVVYPDGLKRAWNAGLCCGPPQRDGVDDVGFIGAVVARLEQTQRIDPERIYVTGMSNGAMMAYRLGCEARFPIAAIGAVAGTLDMPSCANPHRVPVMEIHGLQDRHVPFEGGAGVNKPQQQPFPSVPYTISVWRNADACAAAPRVETAGVVQRNVWSCANDMNVELIAIANAGHEWPQSIPTPGRGALASLLHLAPADPVSDALNATQTLWTFFSRVQ